VTHAARLLLILLMGGTGIALPKVAVCSQARTSRPARVERAVTPEPRVERPTLIESVDRIQDSSGKRGKSEDTDEEATTPVGLFNFQLEYASEALRAFAIHVPSSPLLPLSAGRSPPKR
jgi:hypothetical protein